MTPETRARLFAAVPLYLWPYLWLQLWGLARWIRANKRDVLFAVSHRTGKVYVTAISDAPAPEGLYTYTPPEQFAWERLALPAPSDAFGQYPGIIRAVFGALGRALPSPHAPDTS
ncbi:MAG: hypothetical protein KJ871_12080 [Alphaproteobacteria bacterium]|nr:hypothetical protein [Alphaproteobacteria bacterium]MBU2083000.1 hypothetical protein [Alphaproteobacteria bacterium]MBU2197434.1 hypothetical protein [Alphaproteobacteria bacterium]